MAISGMFLLLATSTYFFIDVVLSDYPPPSVDGHRYYDDQQGAWGLSGIHPGGHGASTTKCVNIPANLSLCKDIGYGQMRLPNLLEHDTIREVTQQASSWVHLLGVRCHADTQMFLCSMFAPVCLDRPIYPCRSLCEAVKSGCEDRMLKYGYPWPEMLRCDQFPSDAELCIGLRPDGQSTDSDNSCAACSQPETFEGIVDNFCSAEFVMRVKVEESLVSGSDLKVVTAKKKKIYKAGSLKGKDTREAVLYIDGGRTGCDCATMDTVNGRRASVNYLVMGNKVNERLVLSMVQPFNRKSKELSRAMRAIKDGSICKGGGIVTASGEGEKTKTGPKPAGTNVASVGTVSGNVGKKVQPRKSDVSGKQNQPGGGKKTNLRGEGGKRPLQNGGSSAGAGKRNGEFPNEVKRVKKNGGDVQGRVLQTTPSSEVAAGGKLNSKNQLPNNNKRKKDRLESKITY